MGLVSKSSGCAVFSVDPVIVNLPLSASPAPGTSVNACVWPASTSVTERSPTVVPLGSFSGRVAFESASADGASLTSPTVTVSALANVAPAASVVATRIE